MNHQTSFGAAGTRRLFKLARNLLLAADLKAVQALAGATIQEMLSADLTLLLLTSDGLEYMTEFDQLGAAQPADGSALLCPYARRALEDHRPILLADLAGADAGVAPDLAELGWSSLLVFPFPSSMPIGVVAALWDQENDAEQLLRQVATIRYMGELVKAAIGNIELRRSLEHEIAARAAEIAEVTHEHAKELQRRDQLEEEIQRISVTDVMTGLLNRRGFFLYAEQNFKLARRHGLSSAMIFVDIDNLKSVNDGLGHSAGDRLIQDAANVLRQSFRDTDVLARLGGDEFAAFTLDAARPQVILDRIQRNVEQFQQRDGLPYRISFSTGIVTCDPQADLSVADYLALADMQMYAQKSRSRPPARPA